MYITEFLLARIGEDEATSYRLVPYACEPDCCAPAGWVGHECLICQDGVSYGGTVAAITEIADDHAERVHRRSRVLAECAAKRRILELEICMACEVEGTMCDHKVETQRVFAAVHADHPDYDPAWRLAG